VIMLAERKIIASDVAASLARSLIEIEREGSSASPGSCA